MATKGTESKPTKDYNAAERKCLNCGSQFQSEWEGHRICPKCKQSGEWANQADDSSALVLERLR